MWTVVGQMRTVLLPGATLSTITAARRKSPHRVQLQPKCMKNNAMRVLRQRDVDGLPRHANGTIRRRLATCIARAAASQEEQVVDEETKLADTLRALPLVAGATGIVGTLANRIFSGVAPVVDASSSQSRTDVLVIGLSAVLLLTGLQWLSLKPKAPVSVELDGGVTADYVDKSLPDELAQELRWAYEASSASSTGRALVVVHRGKCLCHLGAIKKEAQPGATPEPGTICKGVMKNGKGNYLANLILFPGRLEFTSYLPFNTQGVIVQPVGKEGYMVVASDTARSFSSIDQAWFSVLAEKIFVSLGEEEESG